MPTDVAMHEPSTRVVGLESNDQVSRRRQHDDISSGWVGQGECDGGSGVCARALSQDIEIMAV